MAETSTIEWTDATWNPITGCSVVSPGCTHCYAMKLAGTRLARHPSRAGLTQDTKAGPVWTGEVRFNEQWLDQPLRWRRPRRIFVCAHGDLFHEAVPDEWIDQVFAVMALAPQHSFQVLTKRAERMRAYMDRCCGRVADRAVSMRRAAGDNDCVGPLAHLEPGSVWWPLANVWLGVSAEDQQRAVERIPHLLATPAAVRWVSAEPLLGAINLRRLDADPQPSTPPGFYQFDALTGRNTDMGRPCQDVPHLDWVIVGGESGAGARPMHPAWARAIRDQCAEAGVAYFFKQWGSWAPDRPAGFAQLSKNRYSHEAITFLPNGERYDPRQPDQLLLTDMTTLYRQNKKAGGRLLDGAQHDAMPHG